MQIINCYLTQSPWYRGAKRAMKPVGILWHDTGAGNPYVHRYVQPSDNDPNKEELLEILGKNKYGNDWNHTTREVGVNAFIGKFADASIGIAICGELDIHPWGCGGGSKGSCNGFIKSSSATKWIQDGWLQFEICDDKYQDKEYFDAVYKEAVELTAAWCKEFSINPHGTVIFNGVEVPTILCHQDSYRLELGSDHGDVLRWFKTFGKTMDDVRDDVAKLLEEPIKPEPVEPDPIKPDPIEPEPIGPVCWLVSIIKAIINFFKKI